MAVPFRAFSNDAVGLSSPRLLVLSGIMYRDWHGGFLRQQPALAVRECSVDEKMAVNEPKYGSCSLDVLCLSCLCILSGEVRGIDEGFVVTPKMLYIGDDSRGGLAVSVKR